MKEKENGPFENDPGIKEEDMLTGEIPQKKLPIWVVILIPSILFLVIFVFIIIKIVTTKDNPSSSQKYLILKCIYDIQSTSEYTQLMSSEYDNANISIKINGTKNNYNYTLKLESIGITDIEFTIYEEKLKLDNMFKNIYSLISIGISSNDPNYKITSMVSTFEGCMNLKNVKFSNLNTEELKSIHRLFYNSNSLSSINFNELNTKNVEDMSYLFAYSSLNNTGSGILNIDTSNVKNMSHVFYNTLIKGDLDLSKFDTKNVKDMSHMFFGLNELEK